MIHIQNLSLTFNSVPIFNGLTFLVQENEKVILNAKSGKGKTTLLKIILGFENSYTGSVRVNDLPLNPSTVYKIRKAAAYVSQDVDLPSMKAGEFLQQTFSFSANADKTLDMEQFHKMADTFRLPDNIAEMEISELSGGERQRLGIITAILLDRPVLLMDEPTSALDTEMKRTTADYIVSLEKTILAVSHDEIWHSIPGTRMVNL